MNLAHATAEFPSHEPGALSRADATALLAEEPAMQQLSKGVATSRNRAALHLKKERAQIVTFVCFVWLLAATMFATPGLVRAGEFDAPTILSHLAISIIAIISSLALLIGIVWVAKLPRVPALMLTGGLVFGLASALSSLDIIIFDRIFSAYDPERVISSGYAIRWTANLAIFVTQLSLISAIFWTLESLSRHRAREYELQEARLAETEARNAARMAKLTALRFQLNPHFLFNTLNSISSLVVTARNEAAEEMLGRLSDFLRATLVADPSAPQTLERELDTIDTYLGIERVRFGDRLGIEVECPSELRNAQMPAFLVQPLVENAVKYAVSRSIHPVTIRVEASCEGGELMVLVEDDAVASSGLTAPASGTGIGLRNIRERLQSLYGEQARLETFQRTNGFAAIVRLPLQAA